MTLTQGDIAITAYNADGNDDFAWVTLVDIPANTLINFTDSSWQDNGFRTTEHLDSGGPLTWTHTETVTAGTVIRWNGSTANTWSLGTGSGSALALAVGGDQIFILTGTVASPIFIYGAHFASATNWLTSGSNSTNTSNIPPGISVEAGTAFYAGNFDNGYYSGSTTGIKAELLAALANTANWTRTDTGPINQSNWVSNFTVEDTASPGLDLKTSNGSTEITEGSQTDTYTLVLNTQPTDNVTVTIDTDSQSTTTPASLVFTPLNWNIPQEVTVIAVDDGVLEGTHSTTISHTVTSNDVTYNGLNIANIVATITDNDEVVVITKIHEIQGTGESGNFLGSFRTIEGIVIGDFQVASGVQNLRGFYIQEEDTDIDGNALTSEGIFIFDDNFGVDVKVGDQVRITGEVREFTSSGSSLTQLGNLTNVTVLSENNLLPSASTLSFPLMSVDDLEAFEGMRVNIPQTLTVTEHFQLGRFGQIVLSADGNSNQPGTDGRLEQYTQFNAPSVTGYSSYLEEIAKVRIILDDGQTIQNPDPIIHGGGGVPLSANNTLRGGNTVSGLSGILDERFGEYRIQPVNPVNFISSNLRPETAPDVAGRLKVASFNVLNYFNGDGLGGGFPTARGAESLVEFNRQRDKIVAAVLGIDADVLGLIELENDGYGSNSAVQDLVNNLNAVAGAGTYAVNDPGFAQIGTDEIAVGSIYKPGKVTPVGVAATIPDGFGQGAFDNNNRKPLAQTFQENSTGEEFTVVINHFKSKGSSAGGPGDADIGDGQGLSNGTRTRAAQDLATWLATNPTGTTDPDYLIMGDINAYPQEDPITALKTAGYQNLISNSNYSYVFNGQWGSLDYALANASLAKQVTGASKWHINADEPNVFDYNTNFKSANHITSLYSPNAFRSSDHDPVIVGLNLTNQKPTDILILDISPYDPQQDLNGQFTISDDQTQLDLLGNTWKKLDINNYTITKDTILEFEFQSTRGGEIHAIGFDTDNVVNSPQTTFQLSGTQNWGIGDFNNYTIGQGWKSYTITVGDYFTGDFNYLTFANDHDVLNPDARSEFRNLKIYENTNSVAVNINNQTNNYLFSSYDPKQDLNGQFTISQDKTQLDLLGNTWKKLDINNYTITKDTILEFEFQSTRGGEIHAIGFDTDNVNSAQTTFKLSGTQNWGLGDFNNYTIGQGWKSYTIT
ncbi:ExeM/NucH family extracellular endonuclease, partial [Umezakia ovalisporum]|uniref:ExeM/NucH family extracellular endonuclease n=2 Tax=Umezakia ovalisporum TaxID=75695 RepID=UPI0039C6D7CF